MINTNGNLVSIATLTDRRYTSIVNFEGFYMKTLKFLVILKSHS